MFVGNADQWIPDNSVEEQEWWFADIWDQWNLSSIAVVVAW